MNRADRIRAESEKFRAHLAEQGMAPADALAQQCGFLMGCIEGLCVQIEDFEATAAQIAAYEERFERDCDAWRDDRIAA